MGTSAMRNNSDFYSVLSIAIVLFLIALYGLLFLHASNISSILKERINLIIELDADIEEMVVQDLQSSLSEIEGIKTKSIQMIPKEKAIATMHEYIAEMEFLEGDSPFRDMIVFNLNAQDYSEDKIKEIETIFQRRPGVANFYAENESIAYVKESVQKLSFGSLGLGLFVVLLALAIVFNTIKLRLHADRLEIKTQQLVGATRSFIARPYLRDALSIAGKSFAWSAGLVLVVILSLVFNVDYIGDIINWIFVILVLVATGILSIVMTVGIARMVVKGYLDSNKTSLLG